MYRIFYDQATGKPSLIVNPQGLQLPFDFTTQTFDELNDLVVELRAWETTNGNLDLTPQAGESLEERKNQLKTRSYDYFNSTIDSLVEKYSKAEQATWTRKVAESKAFLASGQEADAPLIAYEAGLRGKPTTDLANKILQNYEALHFAASQFVAKRNLVEELIDGLTEETINQFNLNDHLN